MNTNNMQAATKVCHVVAMPYPARGHINPLLILSKLLASKKDDILITFVLTEEWHRTIASEVFPPNIRFATISNDVIPSAQLQAADVVAFFRTVKLMAAPFEQILDRLDPPVTTIITDILLPFVIEAGYSRNIPVALFWAPSTTTFTILYHAHLFDKGIPVNMVLEIKHSNNFYLNSKQILQENSHSRTNSLFCFFFTHLEALLLLDV
ncbi:hypothetical protein ACOSQ3_022153 [Xanthoceras sorbifolium]